MKDVHFAKEILGSNMQSQLKPSVLPERPWAKIGMDLFYMNGKDYLVVVDYFSRWIEIVNLEDTTSIAVVQRVKNMFARWGIPDKVRSDNGPQFVTASFRALACEYGFSHTTSDLITHRVMGWWRGQFRQQKEY